jgi:hypothetical protein
LHVSMEKSQNVKINVESRKEILSERAVSLFSQKFIRLIELIECIRNEKEKREP